jgi:hypothetical protein
VKARHRSRSRAASVEQGASPEARWKSAVMQDATCGEPIARADACSNERDQTGAGTLEGLASPFHVQRAVHGGAEARVE